MTREDKIAKLAQLRSDAEALVTAYNEAMLNGRLQESVKATADAVEKINEYTGIVRDMCFEDCKNSENPMITAVKMLTFTTIGIKDEQKGDDKVPVRTLIEKERQIDLLKLHKYCGSIGADQNWPHIAQQMNFLLTVQKCIDLGIDPKSVNDSYSMTALAKEVKMGKNPTSKTNLLKTLQLVVSAMLGDGFKATSHDVNFLLSVYAKKNKKALTVTCANHKFFRNYLAEICHRIVTNKHYEVEYRKKKDA